MQLRLREFRTDAQNCTNNICGKRSLIKRKVLIKELFLIKEFLIKEFFKKKKFWLFCVGLHTATVLFENHFKKLKFYQKQIV